MYDYAEVLRRDIRAWIEDNPAAFEKRFGKGKITDFDRYEVEQFLHDELWAVDEVTGNGYNGYDITEEEAEQYVKENLDEAIDAIKEFCVPAEELGRRLLNGEWKYLDCTIRVNLLGQAISEVLDNM